MSGELRPATESTDVDVLVIGGGPAGLGAALGAASLGAKTLLIERMAFLGGVGAIGLGMTINQMRPEGQARSHVHELLIRKLQRFGSTGLRIEDHALITNTEYLKLAAFESLEEVGADYLLYAFASKAIVNGNTITGVVASTKNGPLCINAKRVVDSTGDGDVAFFAGCPLDKGRAVDGFLSPMTSLFVIGGVDQQKVREGQTMDPGWRLLLDGGRRDGYVLPERMRMTPTVYLSCVYVNHSGTKDQGIFDGTNSHDLTRAERLMRQQAADVVRLLKDRQVPGFENAYLEQVSAWAGVRETRRIIGEYVLTEEDAKSGARFPDAVAKRSGSLDIGYVRLEEMAVHDVPYRALIPRRIDNLLASGRNISTTHVGMSAGKSMGNCMATGHAAGVASALSIREGVSPRRLDVRLLQRALVEQGVPLDIR